MFYIFLHFIRSHIKIPPSTHSKTTPRIFLPKLINLRTTREHTKQPTLRVELPNNPPRTLSLPLDQNIPITRINRNTIQITHEQFFYYFPVFYLRACDSPFETPRRRKHIDLKTVITFITDNIDITRECTHLLFAAGIDSNAFDRCPHAGTPGFRRLTIPFRFTEQFIAVPDILRRVRRRTSEISRFAFRSSPCHRPPYFRIPGARVI